MVDPAFALLAILLLAVVFGTAALAKLRDLDVFQGVVEQYQLLPRAPGEAVRPYACRSWSLAPRSGCCCPRPARSRPRR